MNSVYLKIFKRFFLFTSFIFAVTGCGSSSSTANNETGSIAAKVVWRTPEDKTTAKTLYAFPAGVTSIRIFVQDSVNNNLLPLPGFQEFNDPNASSGTITGIPAGNGRKVRVEGLGSNGAYTGVIIYLGTATVNVVAGPTPTPVTITMEAPATTVSPASAPSAASFPVTLSTSVPATIYYTTSQPATIYYTTNGATPNTGSPQGTSPVSLSVTPPVTLKFFAVVLGLYEAVKEKTY